jgi:hypothetical protein
MTTQCFSMYFVKVACLRKTNGGAENENKKEVSAHGHQGFFTDAVIELIC